MLLVEVRVNLALYVVAGCADTMLNEWFGAEGAMSVRQPLTIVFFVGSRMHGKDGLGFCISEFHRFDGRRGNPAGCSSVSTRERP